MRELGRVRCLQDFFGSAFPSVQSLCTFYIPSASQDNSKTGAEGEDPELSITSLADNAPPPAPEYHSGFLKNWKRTCFTGR